mgnify:CR=1 FL=1
MKCVIVVLIGVAGAINCYQCRSWQDTGCGDQVEDKYLIPCESGICLSSRSTIHGITGQSVMEISYLVSKSLISAWEKREGWRKR